MRMVFESLDVNNSGSLTLEEFKAAIHELGAIGLG